MRALFCARFDSRSSMRKTFDAWYAYKVVSRVAFCFCPNSNVLTRWAFELAYVSRLLTRT